VRECETNMNHFWVPAGANSNIEKTLVKTKGNIV